MAHVLLHRDHIPRIVLSRQFDIGYRSDVIRRVAKESRRRRGGRGRSYQGGLSEDVILRSVSQTVGYKHIVLELESLVYIISCLQVSKYISNISFTTGRENLKSLLNVETIFK